MLLSLDFGSETPIYQQIRNQIVQGIASGELAEGQRLPTIRVLADESGINMMTVNKAYALLKQEGYIITDRRGGTTVASAQKTRSLAPKQLEALEIIASEARVAGFSEEEFCAACAEAYRKGGAHR